MITVLVFLAGFIGYVFLMWWSLGYFNRRDERAETERTDASTAGTEN